MSQEKNEKKCSGCKSSKPLNQFYKNRLVLDGHSNYCIECTRENSKRYFQRKKEKVAKSFDDNLMKKVLLSNFSNDQDSGNADNLMKILMIEKMVKSTLEEIEGLKRTYIKSDNLISQ
jgi:glutaredoxin 2